MGEQFASYEELMTSLFKEGFLGAVTVTPELATDILNHDPMNRELRKGNFEKLKRTIYAKEWDPRKSPPICFLPSRRLADGQHRLRAVIATGRSIVVSMAVIPNTLGLDQGAPRSLPDQLRHHAGITDKQELTLAAAVTKSICDIPYATDTDLASFFDANREFIMACVRKPLEWLSDKEVSVIAVMKPTLLAVTRAQGIRIYGEPESEVDDFLYDVVNGGVTAPEGSVQRNLAKQIWDALQAAHTRRGAKVKDVIRWTRNALRYRRENKTRNAITAKKRKKAEAESPQLAVA